MPDLRFILQGLNKNDDHYGSLKNILSLSNINMSIISAAFVNATGIKLFIDDLVKIKNNLTMYIGIRNGITSKQAIMQLISNGINPICIDTATQAYIFHPKIYLAKNLSACKVLIGSSNFTTGGLIKNIEANVELTLDCTNNDDMSFINSILTAFENLRNNYSQNVFVIDSSSDLDEMVNQGLLVDETSLIPKSIIKSKNINVRESSREKMNLNIRQIPTIKKPKTASPTNAIINNKLLWKSSPLSRRDLNIPTASGTNQTGSMLLKLGDRSQVINFQHYFRDEVFADANWTRDTNPRTAHKERALIDFNVIIKGINQGVFSLEVSHNTDVTSRTYLQRNAMTQIHWGDLKPLVAKEDLLNGILCIYAPENGSNIYTITIDVN